MIFIFRCSIFELLLMLIAGAKTLLGYTTEFLWISPLQWCIIHYPCGCWGESRTKCYNVTELLEGSIEGIVFLTQDRHLASVCTSFWFAANSSDRRLAYSPMLTFTDYNFRGSCRRNKVTIVLFACTKGEAPFECLTFCSICSKVNVHVNLLSCEYSQVWQ